MKTLHADENGWVSSSHAWRDRMPETGDFAGEFILDKIMVEPALNAKSKNMLNTLL